MMHHASVTSLTKPRLFLDELTAKLSRQSTGSPGLSPRVSASFAGMPLVVKRKATDALLDAELRHLSVSCTAKLISRNFSHDRRCCELASSCLIFWLSLASLFRSSARAFLSNSSVHSRRDFSSLSLLLNGEELLHLVTLLVYSRSKSSLSFCLRPACLRKSSHASSFLSWRRCFISARFLQQSRSFRRFSSFMPVTLARIRASSLPVALTNKLTTSSAKATAS